jgi:hypothetical protein
MVQGRVSVRVEKVPVDPLVDGMAEDLEAAVASSHVDGLGGLGILED